MTKQHKWHPISEQIHLGNPLCTFEVHEGLFCQADLELHRSKATLHPYLSDLVVQAALQLKQSVQLFYAFSSGIQFFKKI